MPLNMKNNEVTPILLHFTVNHQQLEELLLFFLYYI